jgi:8-oxo-dGTP pyrophosphatase MutT (NUDIX family)
VPSLRADIVDAYVLRRTPGIELLQLRRTGAPLAGTWQPVMGHVEAGETAVGCLWRELEEETGLARDTVLGAWALEQVHPFFIAEIDAVVMSPRFAVEVGAGWSPMLNGEHDAHRWVPAEQAEDAFLWPGQHAAIAELEALLETACPRRDLLRLP